MTGAHRPRVATMEAPYLGLSGQPPRWLKYRIRHANRQRPVCGWLIDHEDVWGRPCMLRVGHQGTCLPRPRGSERQPDVYHLPRTGQNLDHRD